VLNALKKYGGIFVTQYSFTARSHYEFENSTRDSLVVDIDKVRRCNAGLNMGTSWLLRNEGCYSVARS